MSIQIFLAHASEDKASVLELYERLKAKGYKPWLDERSLVPGQNWREEIPKAIRHSQIFIACLSKRFVSKQGYIQRELRMALNEYAEKPPGSIYLIPLKLESCDVPDLRLEQLGVGLKDLHWLNYWESDGFERLIRAIEYKFRQVEEEESEEARLSAFTETQLSLSLPEDPLERMEELPLEDLLPELEVISFSSPFEYEVVLIDDQGKISKRQTCQGKYQTVGLGKGISLELMRIPGERLYLDLPASEPEATENPKKLVIVESFWMGKYSVTQEQWKAVAMFPKVDRVLKPDPSNFKGDNLPVEQVSWYDAMEFCKRLSKKTRCEYRLPNQVEWEYACRAGTKTPFHFGETITTDLANYNGKYTYGYGPKGEYRRKTTPVGNFNGANAFGLYDMHGNVWEWCLDHWHKSYQDVPSDEIAGETVSDYSFRLLRGGSWSDDPVNCCSSAYNPEDPDYRDYNIGLRVVSVSPAPLT